MAIRFETSGWQASESAETRFGSLAPVSVDYLRLSSGTVLQPSKVNKSRLAQLDRPAGFSILPVYETPSGFWYIGESTNEAKSVPHGEESDGSPVKGHNSQKDGLAAGMYAAKTTTSGRTLLET